METLTVLPRAGILPGSKLGLLVALLLTLLASM
jgi:hypothetical protein